MFEGRKKRRDLNRRIEDVDQRIQRTAAQLSPDLMGMAVINLRWEKDRLNGSLRQLDTDEWFARAKKHHIKVPQSDEYWQEVVIDQTETQTLLTDEGKHFIKTAIHEKRFRLIQQWGWLVAIIGVVLSLIISIMALLKK